MKIFEAVLVIIIFLGVLSILLGPEVTDSFIHPYLSENEGNKK